MVGLIFCPISLAQLSDFHLPQFTHFLQYKDADVDARIREDSQNNLQFAIDAVCQGNSTTTAYKAMGSKGGRIITVMPRDQGDYGTRSDIRIEMKSVVRRRPVRHFTVPGRPLLLLIPLPHSFPLSPFSLVRQATHKPVGTSRRVAGYRVPTFAERAQQRQGVHEVARREPQGRKVQVPPDQDGKEPRPRRGPRGARAGQGQYPTLSSSLFTARLLPLSPRRLIPALAPCLASLLLPSSSSST